MPGFKAIELDATSRQRTGREYVLAADNRQAAIDALLALLGVRVEDARIDPTRTLVHVESRLWTLVMLAAPPRSGESSAMRRAGAKHKRVR
jgi:hypothetical protein